METGSVINVKRTEKSDSAPISNYAIAGVTILLGPVAGGILTYISLKKLGKETAIYALLTSFLATAIVSYILMVPLSDVDINGIFIQVPLALLFIGFQHNAVKNWAENNPTIKFRTTPKDIIWALLGVVIYFLIAFIVAVLVVPV